MIMTARRVAPHAGAWIETEKPLWARREHFVAPHAGAWIETLPLRDIVGAAVASRPMRARGLKLIVSEAARVQRRVAPHAGAWIETNSAYSLMKVPAVAPHAGAWIETYFTSVSRKPCSGRAPCGRVD